MSSKRNTGFTFIIITALTKTLKMNRHLIKELPAYTKNWSKAAMWKATKKHMTNFLKLRQRPKEADRFIIKEAHRYLGNFVLISNEKIEAFTTLHLYRMKNVVEKAFNNLKERLNMRRLLVSSRKELNGKIFVEFIALILISYLNHKMMKTDLYKNYTLQQLLDKFGYN